MKTNQSRNNRNSILFSLAALLLFPFISHAQLRVSTTGGVTVGDTTSTSYGLNLNNATGTNNYFQISGNKVLWYNGNTADIFVGYHAGNSTMSGHNNTFMGNSAGYVNGTGHDNSFMGYQAGLSNNTGYNNSAYGGLSLSSNTTGYHNTAVGLNALYSNISGVANTAIGLTALYSNTSGSSNTASGMYTLHGNITGSNNTATGYAAQFNTTGSSNTSVGYNSTYFNTTGFNNTAIGYSAGGGSSTIIKDTSCTFIGYGADADANCSNATAIGNGAIAHVRNRMYFGNANVTGLYTTVGIFATSDGRFKTNVTENVKGLAFINKLRPVTYKLDTKALDDFIMQNMSDSAKIVHREGMDFDQSMSIVHSGFIAQEVELAEQQVGFTSSIVSTPANSTDPYALSYSEIVVPLVKAVQELSKVADSTNIAVAKKDSINDAKLQNMQDQINQLTSMINSCCTNNHSLQQNSNSNSTGIDVNLKDGQTIVLDQNVPNPFAEQTTINYFLPDNVVKAQMLFYNAQGKLIQSVDLNEKGKGSLNVFANDLSNGIYTYTLVADGKIIETKKMVKQK